MNTTSPSGAPAVASSPYLSPAPDGGLLWGTLAEGRLVRRYKRFLADVELDDGQIITAHTPNTGRMTGCSEPGRPVWLSRHDRPGRKHPHTLEMIAMPTALVGVNTMVPNRLTAEAARRGLLPELGDPAVVETEVPLGRSRLDMRLTAPDGRQTLVEIKNCTLAEQDTAYFPDAVTARGLKHLEELAALARLGSRAVIFIVVQRADAHCFSPADHIDPAWGLSLRRALAEGVEILAYRADLSLTGISLGARLPVMIR